jgi:hypothetical protein
VIVMRIARKRAVLVLVLVCGSSCGFGAPLRFSDLQLGRSLNSDNSVAAHTTRFKPEDTVYVSVLTEGPGSGTIVAKWSYEGRALSEISRDVSYSGEAATEFHIAYPSGLAPGGYKVEILLDGQPVGVRDFRVER